jgi:hypothetical protein
MVKYWRLSNVEKASLARTSRPVAEGFGVRPRAIRNRVGKSMLKSE